MAKPLQVVIITGMSGAGKTVAVQSFEDLGYFVIDNMLPNLAEKFADVIQNAAEFDKMAMVMDSRSQEFYDQILPCIQRLKSRTDLQVEILFWMPAMLSWFRATKRRVAYIHYRGKAAF